MSDVAIGPKLGVMLGGVLALAVGVVLFLGAATIGVILVRDRSWPARFFRYTAGPLACIGFAIAFMIVVQFLSTPTLWWFDARFKALPLVGLAVGLATTVATELRRSRR